MIKSIFLFLLLALMSGPAACSKSELKGGQRTAAVEPKAVSEESLPIPLPDMIKAPEESAENAQADTSLSAPRLSSISGEVRNSQDITPIAGARIQISPPAAANPPLSSATDGSFESASLAAGNYKLTVSAPGFIDFNQDISLAEGEAKKVDVLMSKILGANEFRVVVSWGAQPYDVDSHLEIINASTGSLVSEINYNNKFYTDAAVTAFLDIDDTESDGPETTSVRIEAPGTYRFRYYLHNYRGESGATSDIVVKLYRGANLLNSYSLSATDPGLEGAWNWSVFTFDASLKLTDVKKFFKL